MRQSLPVLSLIIPTRQRTASLARLLDSLVATAEHPGSLEVVLVVDADDEPSRTFRHPTFSLIRVIVPPGQTMGALNSAGYEASSGEFLMLLNDDVVARTPGWDSQILRRLRRYPDGIVLVHVNDTLLGPHLCVFPVVSRTFCRLAGGICPADYVRYRIDDHIEDLFNLLAFLGHRRTIYLPDVVFEHFNAVAVADGRAEYHSVPDILALDAPRFLAHFEDRKECVLRLLEHIEGPRRAREHVAWRRRLAALEDPFALRVPGRLQIESDLPAWRILLRALGRQARQTFALGRRAFAALARRARAIRLDRLAPFVRSSPLVTRITGRCPTEGAARQGSTE
jgi:hypothetical protein